ncbi:hypothetical protein QBC46DRAFT_283427 [Diplogelasinospora grovesii]|uniref:Helix-turn-helix domain-containing protein n=1 Tax=Diplogelasinospora grovesii TaxID=303347 RepID=A0AAN6NC78_9PEZI|nr:hypothetical protein QBC46DRAFT_283427 [Diplogelasinospora grovesii]
MGASGSKAAQSASKAAGAARKFPSRAPGTSAAPPPPRAAPTTSRPPPEPKGYPQASFTKDEAIRADGIDPQGPEDMNPAFSDRLKQLGVVQPNPTYSPSSTAGSALDASQFQSPTASHFPPASNFPSASNNATLGVLEARRQLQEKADEEFNNMGTSADRGKEFLSVATIRDILVLRERGESASAIESRLRLKRGVVARLGPQGLVETAS